MKASLQPGVSHVKRITIGPRPDHQLHGDEGRVYATPRLIGDSNIPVATSFSSMPMRARIGRGRGRHQAIWRQRCSA